VSAVAIGPRPSDNVITIVRLDSCDVLGEVQLAG
jgi:hypothetical protein